MGVYHAIVATIYNINFKTKRKRKSSQDMTKGLARQNDGMDEMNGE